MSVLHEIVDWSKETFHRASMSQGDAFRGIVNHLADEWDELEETGFSDPQEMADLVFLLAQLADCQGYDLDEELRKKLATNRARAWPSEPDDNGVYHHVA